jgi:elongator complex protein 6
MPPTSRIPPLLQPLVRTPKNNSLLLLTSTLDASANWLLTRFLCDALGSGQKDIDHGGAKNVVLVSWMRDYEFWRQEARKGTGLDLGGLRTQGKFAFVDGLSGLFLPTEQDEADQQRPQSLPASPAGTPAIRGPQSLPVRAPPGRTIPTAAQASPRPPASPHGIYALSSTALEHIDATINAAIASLRPSAAAATRTLVILDNPDILLACVPGLSHSALTSFFLGLHTQPSVSHLLVHLQSDLALLASSERPVPLQIAQHNLVVKTAHMSAKVLGVRVLDTGVARDVSGVLRVTVNRDSWANIATVRDGQEGGAVQAPEEMGSEMLYKVNGDGSVKVFERGAEVAV